VLRDVGRQANPPKMPFSEQDQHLPLIVLIEKRALETPNKIACVTPGGSLTYRETVRAVLGLALRIREVQTEIKASVCVFDPQGLLHIVAGLACLCLGAPYVPLDPAFTVVRNLQIASRAGGKVLVCAASDPAAAQTLLPDAVIVEFDAVESEAAGLADTL